MLIWPYAVATMVAGVLWLFMFNPNVGVVAWFLKHKLGYEWQHLLNTSQALILLILAASWKQISYNFVFFLAGLQSVPNDSRGGGRHRRGGAVLPILENHLPPTLPDDLLPARDEPRVRLLRDLPHQSTR